jgi:hypothetical protein
MRMKKTEIISGVFWASYNKRESVGGSGIKRVACRCVWMSKVLFQECIF